MKELQEIRENLIEAIENNDKQLQKFALNRLDGIIHKTHEKDNANALEDKEQGAISPAFPVVNSQYGTTTGINKLDYFAAYSMDIVMSETQEMVVASIWDWVKQLLQVYLHFNFLTVKHKPVDNVYKEASIRAYNYAEAMVKESQKRLKNGN